MKTYAVDKESLNKPRISVRILIVYSFVESLLFGLTISDPTCGPDVVTLLRTSWNSCVNHRAFHLPPQLNSSPKKKKRVKTVPWWETQYGRSAVVEASIT
jgi:hypothetical protein